VQQVSSADRDQSRGMEQIVQTITQMDQVTQANAANAEENAAASEELSAQASAQSSIVRDLASLVLGRNGNGNGRGHPGEPLAGDTARAVPDYRALALPLSQPQPPRARKDWTL